MPEQRITVQVPLGSGLNQRGDARASNPPTLDIALDCQFDEIGGLQTRKPYAALGSNIFGGGTITNARRIVANKDELLLFTDVALYAWNAQLSKWILRGTHLAIKTAEQTRFATNGDQIDADRAELSNAIVYAWSDAGVVYAAALDKATGSVTMAPTVIATTGNRPRLVTLSTRILFLWHTGTDAAPDALKGVAIDPADVLASALGIPQILVSAGTFNLHYDVARLGSTDTAVCVARRVVTTSYSILSINAAMAFSASTKARTNDQTIAVASSSNGLSAQVIRGNSGNLQGDYITIAGLVDATVNQAIGVYGATLNQIAICSRSTRTGGAYRFYVFWSYSETTAQSDWQSWSNWVDDAGTIGTAAIFVRRLGIASRAFDYNGSVYVWGAFAGASTFTGGNLAGFRAQLQNTYFLYRDDGLFVALAGSDKAGGFSATQSHLPGVALTSGTTTYSWCGGQRRIIEVGTAQTSYAKRSPLDITAAFDSNEARRTARIGRTLYVTGAEILGYDGAALNEIGTHIYPWAFAATQTAGGSKANGTYAYKVTEKWENAAGEIDRSTCATVAQVTIAAGPAGVLLAIVPLYETHKTAPAIEVWASAVDPTPDAPFYLVTSLDPSVTGTNGYIANDATASATTFTDFLSDASVILRQNNPENGAVLPNLAPPAATIIMATDTRVFLAGIAGDPDRVWYSKQRGDGEVAAFNDALIIDVPTQGGDITGLGYLNETLIVFRQYAVYAFPGGGYDNLGQGSNYGPAQLLSVDVGATVHESIALIDEGLIFKSSKGWHILDKRWSVQYIGAQVTSYDAEAIYAVRVVPGQQQIRILTSARVLIFDTVAKEWGEWTIADGLDACVWQGTYVYLTTTGPKTEQTTFSGTTYGQDIELAWLKTSDLQGAGAVRAIMALGEYRSSCSVRIRIAYNYEVDSGGNPNYVDDHYWTATPTVVGGPLQFKIGPSRQRCEAIKIRLTAVSTANDGTAPTGEALKWTGLSLRIGVNPDLYTGLAVSRKA